MNPKTPLPLFLIAHIPPKHVVQAREDMNRLLTLGLLRLSISAYADEAAALADHPVASGVGLMIFHMKDSICSLHLPPKEALVRTSVSVGQLLK